MLFTYCAARTQTDIEGLGKSPSLNCYKSNLMLLTAPAGAAASPEVLAGQLLAVELEADAVNLVLQAQQEQLQLDEEDDWVSTHACRLPGATLLRLMCCGAALEATCGVLPPQATVVPVMGVVQL